MYPAFIKKELLSNIFSLRYALTFALFIILTLCATVTRTHVFTRQLDDYRQTMGQRSHLTEEALKQNDAQALQVVGTIIEQEPNPLSIFAGGLENENTRSFRIVGFGEPRTGMRPLHNPSFSYFLNLDMVLIINLVCSLLAMLLVYDAVCGERENGTLKVLLAGPLPRDTIIISKLIAGLITLLVPLLLCWGISVFYVLLVGHITFTAEHAARLFWIVATSVLYISFYFALGIAVSSWVQRTATALAVCLFCWVIFVLAIPNLVPLAIKHFVPVPPVSKIVLEKDAITRYIEAELVPQWRAEASSAGEQDLWSMLQKIETRKAAEQHKRFEKVDQYYSTLIKRQAIANQQISRISPSASFVFAATNYAGTGINDFLRLQSEIATYQRTFSRFDDDLRAKTQRQQNNGPKLTTADYIAPLFMPRKVQLAAVVNTCWIDIVLLCGGSVMLLLIGVVGFMRYDPK